LKRIIVCGLLAALAMIFVAPAQARLVEGTSGHNTLNGTARADTMHGYAGNDLIRGRAGADSLYGGTGADSLTGGHGRDYLYGRGGNDWISAQDGERDVIYCGTGNDFAQIDAELDIVAANCEGVGGLGPP
jgi:Ca2+-binding RTX toxin-like protein